MRLRRTDYILSSIVLTVFALMGCGLESESKQTDIPNMNLAVEFNIDTTMLLYQYYQKFGFTDVCEDIRMMSRMEGSPGLKKNLPISADDLAEINSMANKVDSLQNHSFSSQSLLRAVYRDIELDFIEFERDSSYTIGLMEGEYEISKSDMMSTIKIYDSKSGLYAIEVHRGDGR